MWNNGHISNLHKQVYLLFIPNRNLAPNTYNATWKPLLTCISTNLKVITKKSSQHIQLHRLGADNLKLGAKLFALCISADQKSVSEQRRSESVWGVVSRQFWLARVGAGWEAADAPRHLPSSRHPIQGVLRCEWRSPRWCSWLWADRTSRWADCRLPSGCLCTSSCPCSSLQREPTGQQVSLLT